MEIKKNPTMNCYYSLRNDGHIFYSEVLYSKDNAIAVYLDDKNEVKVFATVQFATKRYVEWFAKEMQETYGKYPTIKFYDIKRRDRLFRSSDGKHDGATFGISLRRLKKAMELDYIDKDDCQNGSPTASQMLNFALQHKDKGIFTFGGYLIYPPRADFRATIDSIEVDIRHPQMEKLFKEFTQTADVFDGKDLTYYAWWD